MYYGFDNSFITISIAIFSAKIFRTQLATTQTNPLSVGCQVKMLKTKASIANPRFLSVKQFLLC